MNKLEIAIPLILTLAASAMVSAIVIDYTKTQHEKNDNFLNYLSDNYDYFFNSSAMEDGIVFDIIKPEISSYLSKKYNYKFDDVLSNNDFLLFARAKDYDAFLDNVKDQCYRTSNIKISDIRRISDSSFFGLKDSATQKLATVDACIEEKLKLQKLSLAGLNSLSNNSRFIKYKNTASIKDYSLKIKSKNAITLSDALNLYKMAIDEDQKQQKILDKNKYKEQINNL